MVEFRPFAGPLFSYNRRRAICDRIRIQGWEVFRDPSGRMGPYATFNDQWVSFDDDFMARHKAEYVRAMGLGGNMIWALDLDDFTGRYCGCGRYPLLTNINYVLRDKEAPPPCQLVELQGPIVSSTAVVAGGPVDIALPEPEPDPAPYHPEIDSDVGTSGPTLEGQSCSGVRFRADDADCSKYYLCINGQYVHLTCPAPLYWNKNHCDLPAKSQCRSKAQLRLPADDRQSEPEDKPILACYFTNWAYYRQGNGSYGPDQVDASLCTHIIYTWAHLDSKSHELVPGNPELDIDNDFYGKITGLRERGIKIILGAGGLKDSEDDKWNRMAASSENRRILVDSILKLLQKWNFDGVQIAWQYPVCKQTPCAENSKHSSEKENFNVLLHDLSSALRHQNLELSAMVSSNPEIASLAYDPLLLAGTTDWLAIAANDYYASTSGRTAYLMPLESSNVPEINSFNSTLAYWASVMPTRQLVMGVPAYARSYTLRRSVHSTPGASATGPGHPGPYTNVPGFLAYYEICSGFSSGKWLETQTAEGTYAVEPIESQWASYLRPAEAHRVAASASLAGLRGVALWSLDLDDFRAACACTPHPLLTALRQGLYDPSLPPTLCL